MHMYIYMCVYIHIIHIPIKRAVEWCSLRDRVARFVKVKPKVKMT